MVSNLFSMCMHYLQLGYWTTRRYANSRIRQVVDQSTRGLVNSRMTPIIENKSSAVADMGDRGHNRHGRKRGGCCAPFAQKC